MCVLVRVLMDSVGQVPDVAGSRDQGVQESDRGEGADDGAGLQPGEEDRGRSSVFLTHVSLFDGAGGEGSMLRGLAEELRATCS